MIKWESTLNPHLQIVSSPPCVFITPNTVSIVPVLLATAWLTSIFKCYELKNESVYLYLLLPMVKRSSIMHPFWHIIISLTCAFMTASTVSIKFALLANVWLASIFNCDKLKRVSLRLFYLPSFPIKKVSILHPYLHISTLPMYVFMPFSTTSIAFELIAITLLTT